MQKIDFTKLNKAQLEFVKYVEQQNKERILKLKRVRKNNLLTAGVLGCFVLGVYSYTLFAVKQEHTFDDFEEPQRVFERS